MRRDQWTSRWSRVIRARRRTTTTQQKRAAKSTELERSQTKDGRESPEAAEIGSKGAMRLAKPANFGNSGTKDVTANDDSDKKTPKILKESRQGCQRQAKRNVTKLSKQIRISHRVEHTKVKCQVTKTPCESSNQARALLYRFKTEMGPTNFTDKTYV